MAIQEAPRPAKRRTLCAAVVLVVAAGAVGAGFAAREIAQARSLLRSQRLRIVLEKTKPGGAADLIVLPGVKPDRVVIRRGPGPRERTELRTYGRVRVTVRFGPAHPKGLVTRIEGKCPAMAWPPGRAPGGEQGNVGSGCVVPLAARCCALRC